VGDATGSKTCSRICNGAVANIRSKVDKIGLWIRVEDATFRAKVDRSGFFTRGDPNVSAIVETGKLYKEFLGSQDIISFELHYDSAKKTASTVKAMCKI